MTIPLILLVIPKREMLHLGRTQTQQKVLLLLSDLPKEDTLNAKQISNKIGVKFNTVYKELQRLVKWKLIMKKERRYNLNPEYSELMLQIAMKLKGIKQPPLWLIVIKKVDEAIKILASIKKTARKEIPIPD